MSDNRPDSNSSSLPNWIGDALREPVESRASARANIMDQVFGTPAPRRFSAPMRPSRWVRRGLLAPVGGLMSTLVLTSVLMFRLSLGTGDFSNIELATRVLGDSVVPAQTVSSISPYLSLMSGRPTSHADTSGDTSLKEAHWLDTLRIVEFVIRGSSVHAASVLGEFNRWRRGATPLMATGDDEWRATVLVPRDVLRVAYLVNNAQLLPAEIAKALPVQ